MGCRIIPLLFNHLWWNLVHNIFWHNEGELNSLKNLADILVLCVQSMLCWPLIVFGYHLEGKGIGKSMWEVYVNLTKGSFLYIKSGCVEKVKTIKQWPDPKVISDTVIVLYLYDLGTSYYQCFSIVVECFCISSGHEIILLFTIVLL